MKITKTVFLSLLVLAFGVITAAAAEHTWVGKISDSTCGADHLKGAEHGSKTMSDHDCVLACVKNGGKFVFVHKGKVYNIENQDLPALTEHAGHTVRLKGDLADDSITVSSIVMAAKKKQ
jgi:hypothetical protein